jgi:predicted nucleic acid-binding protein
MLTAQVLAEFLNAIRRKRPTLFADAITKVDQWVSTFPVIDTSGTNLVDAAHFANRHKLQFFDSLIWEVSRSAGAVLFFSEDLQDGFSANGMTVVDPFNPANAQVVAEALLPLD